MPLLGIDLGSQLSWKIAKYNVSSFIFMIDVVGFVEGYWTVNLSLTILRKLKKDNVKNTYIRELILPTRVTVIFGLLSLTLPLFY